MTSGNGDAEDSIVQLIGGARHRVSVALSGNEEQAEAVTKALIERSKTTGEGLAVRFLCTPKALETRLIRSVAPHSAGWEVRVIEDHLVEALVVDGRTALVHNGPRSQEGRIVMLEDPAAARTLELLLAGAWRRAVLLKDYLRLGGRLRSDLGQRILERLCAGSTDAVAAREMKVSLRTYRRHVAEIMRDLGASSRFQAGARAVELRLLPECG
ncbi:DNA-binding response regulator [Streptomyces sp. cmx-4-9]|uniref:DNA-binding response regulator n=1 Tax=Streptomyces sp. cmx-4-9 TaxID=2790941 RepID=UPI003980CB6A